VAYTDKQEWEEAVRDLTKKSLGFFACEIRPAHIKSQIIVNVGTT
jgi:hypothetical protein